MSRIWFGALALLASISLSGCMAIHQVGPGCQDYCEQCDGYSPRPIPYGPLEALANARRSLFCSGGCGEIYYGEWISTPPDCVDPCDCGMEFSGGCREKCYPCGRLRGWLSGLAGQRYRCEYGRGLFNLCDWCGTSCYTDCDACGVCQCDGECGGCGCGSSVLSDESEMIGESVGEQLHPKEVGQFKPMPRARMASSKTVIPASAAKPGCNCGKH